jgi:hypothetical protein
MVGTFFMHNMTHWLSFVNLHRWYAYKWFYSVIDYFWSQNVKNESEVQRKVMDFLASKSKLEEDNVMSKYYVDVLCLQLVLLDSKGTVAEHVPSFVVD